MRHLNIKYVTDPTTGRRWPIPAGGSDDGASDGTSEGDDDQQDDDGQSDSDADESDGDASQLGDAGKRALDAEREARREAERRAKEAEARAAEFEKAQMDEHERAIAEAREEAAAETAAMYGQRLAAARAEALAATRTHDPEAAVQLLGDLSEFVTEDGDVDADAMSAALDQLVEDKPYLAARGGQRFQGDGDGGARKGGSGPPQLTRDDLSRMSPDEIDAARQNGQLDRLLNPTG